MTLSQSKKKPTRLEIRTANGIVRSTEEVRVYILEVGTHLYVNGGRFAFGVVSWTTVR